LDTLDAATTHRILDVGEERFSVLAHLQSRLCLWGKDVQLISTVTTENAANLYSEGHRRSAQGKGIAVQPSRS